MSANLPTQIQAKQIVTTKFLLLADYFFLIPFYLQAVQIHLANVVKLLEA
jgi:hypothetical protein